MSTHKHIDKICCVVLAFTLILSALFMCAEALGVAVVAHPLGYENRLFSTDRVHTIDIVIDDWDKFISTATREEYSICSVVIDGEAIKNVGIRGKGNTSLSSVASMRSQRYSFKIEFDQYDNTKSYHGLDKLSLNNIIQDNTYMKDYLAYQMMNEFGVSAPLCSFAYLTVNGEDWGLYLAVEAVEDSFLMRNYGSNYGELYKPDSMSMGGGRGNGKDFDMSQFENENGGFNFSFGESDSGMPNMGGMFAPSSSSGRSESSSAPSTRPSKGSMSSPGGVPNAGANGGSSSERPSMGGFGGGFGGMGSSDVKLQYISDNASSYSNIFNNAKTDVTEADQKRLIASLKQLSQYEKVDEVVDIDKVIRYFVVHNFVVNGDSYTGSIIHNYYLYEENGQLSMIPWDYNLAFGTFQGANASSSVNESISQVLSDRPMQAWIFSDEAYSTQYYELYAELLETVDAQVIIDNAYNLISSYVKKDPTAFCSFEQFDSGVAALKQFCELRAESVRLQLSGSTEKVNTGSLNISDMGTMGGNKGGFGGNKSSSSSKTEGTAGAQRPSDSSFDKSTSGAMTTAFTFTADEESENKADDGAVPQFPWGGGMPNMGDFDISNLPGGFEMPEGGFDMGNIPEGGQMPGGSFGSGNMPSGGNSQGGGSQGGNFGGGSFPGGNIPGGSFGDGMSTSLPASNDTVLLAVSVGVLLFGLAFAALFKRRR